jgi:hypothetical protein
MLLGTRVQFPPPPLFLYKRQQATVSVKTRLTFLMAVGLRRTRTGVIFAKERQQTAVRVPGALPRALPGLWPNTQTWPWSRPPGPTCPRPFVLALSRWSRPQRFEEFRMRRLGSAS